MVNNATRTATLPSRPLPANPNDTVTKRNWKPSTADKGAAEKSKEELQVRKFPLSVHAAAHRDNVFGARHVVAVTSWGVALNALAHTIAFLPSLFPLIGAYVFGGGYWHWLTFFAAWVVIPIIDLLTGGDAYNLTEEEEKEFRDSIWFRVVTWLHWPIQVALVTWALWYVHTNNLSWVEWIGLVAGVGTVEGFGIGCVHELIHRPDALDLGFGILSLIWSSYGHFWIEHLWAHHRFVATDDDPACSSIGDNVYSFLIQDFYNCFVQAWNIEKKIVNDNGHWTWSLYNRIILGWIGTAIVAYGYAQLFSASVLPFFFVQGIIAAAIVENTNFIEHYGLRRKKLGEHDWERVGWFHSWDTPSVFSNTLLFKIQRHPDHHTNAWRPYQILRTHPDAPTMPTGYAGMIALSWFPPAYRYVMDWRAHALQEQNDEHYRTGKVLGAEYPFPTGARAVASAFQDVDKKILPSADVEKVDTEKKWIKDD